MPDRLRLPRRVAVVAMVAALAGCETSTPDAGTPEASLVLAPKFATAAAVVIPIDAARIRIGRPASGRNGQQQILDTTIVFPAASNQLSLRLRVPLQGRSERLGVDVELLATGTTYYSARDSVDVVAVGLGPASTAELTFQYVGPGSQIRTLRIAPRDSVLTAGDSLRFRLTALDAQNAPVTSFPVDWKTTDPLVAINGQGALLGQARRVTIRVIATLPIPLADTVNLTFVVRPAVVSINGGAGQTGSPGAVLPTPISVIVKGADSLPVQGVAVQFAAIAGGGSVRDPTVMTDAAGIASTVATLGPTPGANSFRATVAGLTPVTFGATAAVGPASRLRALSGGGQVMTPGLQAPQPLLASVSDASGFPIANATVNWTIASGTGSVTAATSQTNASGVAQMTATASTRRGVTLVRASVTGVGSQVFFPISTTPGPASAIFLFNGDGIPVGADPLGPLEVRVRDAFGNAIVGAVVSWTVTSPFGGTFSAPTSTSDARGIASVQYFPDINFNAVTIRAQLAGGQQATFQMPTGLSSGVFYRTGGVVQTLTVGGSLATLLETQSFDGSGFPVSTFPVDWAVIEGGGNVTASTVLTDGNGFSRVGYTSNNVTGPKSIEAFDHSSGQIVRFGFDARPLAPSGLLVASGDGQGVPAGNPLPLPLKVLVVDTFGNPISGVTVNWAALQGGTVGTPVTTTDANGYASTTVTLGATPGAASFRATVAGGLTATFGAQAN